MDVVGLTDHIEKLLLEQDIDLSPSTLRTMARNMIKSPHWHKELSPLLENRLKIVAPGLAPLAMQAISLGVSELVEFLNSPQHLAVMSIMDDAEKKYGSRRAARRAMRRKFGGIGWRRRVRKAVIAAQEQTAK